MRQIVYYVAISLDGYICGPNEDISGFVQAGEGVDHYQNDLQEFDTVIMGRKTYEFGYRFGLEPGTPAYPHMQHFIFSNTLELPRLSDQVVVERPEVGFIRNLKAETGSPIYLCGGGVLAGWMLKHQLIDVLKVKLNPVILGAGTRLFEGDPTSCGLSLKASRCFPEGLQLLTYELQY